jgi:hypothetical protein
MDTTDLASERQRLAQKLGRLYVWLDHNEEHEDFERREKVYLSTLRKYEVTCARMVLEGEPA